MSTIKFLAVLTALALIPLLNIASAGASTPGKASLPSSYVTSTKFVACWHTSVQGCKLKGKGHTACASGGSGKDFLVKNGCPVTNRFRKRLLKLMSKSPKVDPTCRCSRYPKKISFGAGSSNVGYIRSDSTTPEATVKVFYWFQKKHPVVIIFNSIYKHQAWLINDTYCKGNKSTSMYNSPLAVCKAKK
ncbi:MAG TPA: hypothetical protein VFB34_09320 [Chloroflexota bacterium]|nr:hypothetical protein [Chloroflexota bacterium]